MKKFYENHSKYQSLCSEVEFILKKKLSGSDVEVSSISARAKTEASFCEKIFRKGYENPFEEITDFAGARVVYLYSQDKKVIESIVESEFEIIEKVDKVEDYETDEFGYGALHYLIRLKPVHTGARYDELHGLVCELQIRTILQDAWAVVAHHLSYKQESDVPKHLRRKLNALSGLFETADDQFESIRSARLRYQTEVVDKIAQNSELALSEMIELDNFIAYLEWKFPNRSESTKSSVVEMIGELSDYGYRTLKDVDNIINRAEAAVEEYETLYPPKLEEMPDVEAEYSRIGMVRTALSFVDENHLYRFEKDRDNLSPHTNHILELMHLVN
ncbi:hypothetical protein FCV54_25065 [Vibrio sp. F12]|nr:hypothetical protein FCV54_25065 [Vibrio sp. F12]